jgi:PAS domain S-box-containing protein
MSVFTGGALWKLVSRLRRGIALRLLAGVLLFSSVVTLLLTAIQLYLDYRYEVSAIESRLDEIERSYLDSLGESLWNFDDKQLALQVEGILRLPDIQAVELHENAEGRSPLVVTAGHRGTHSIITREYPVVYTFRGNEQPIGVLHVEATLAAVYRELINRTLVILVSQGAKTFLVSLFIIYFFYRLVTRHLTAIAKFVGSYNLNRPPPPLALRRLAPTKEDELEQVVAAFNTMCTSLQRAYGDLRDANFALERDIAARRSVEEELRQSEQRFRDYAETASDWFWETGPDHRLTYVSEAITAFGISRTHGIGKRRWEFAADREEEAEKWRRHIESLDRREPIRGFVYRDAHEDGSPAFVSFSGKPMFDASGRFLGYRGVGSDVTAAVRAEQALREAKEQELRHQAEKMAAEAERLELLERLVNAQEHERLRIARELHDQMGQDLTGLSLGLKSLETAVQGEGGLATLRWLQSLTAQIGGNVHRTAWELRPTSLDDVGLLRALEAYVADWSERFGVPIDFHCAGAAGIRVAPDAETTAYRLVQEALTNVLRHAAANTVSLVLESHGDWLQIIVEDDGRGFDPQAPAARGRLGLASMRERLALIGGTLTIDSAIGVGTTLYFRIPVRSDARIAKSAV